MPQYLLQLAYTPESWAAQLKNPQNRLDVVRPLFERLGGRLESAYLTFGEYDVVGVLTMADNVSAAAVSMVLSGSGAVKAIKTTPLMSVDEWVQAARKGAEASPTYRPPGA